MSITLSKTHKKNIEVLVLAIANKSEKKLPAYLSTNESKAITTMLAKKSLASIRTFSINLITNNSLKHLIICSVGNKDWDNYQLNKWVKSVIASLQSIDALHATIDVDSLIAASKTAAPMIGQLTQLILHHQYRFNSYKSSKPDTKSTSIELLYSNQETGAKQQLSTAVAIDKGKVLARNMANMPANDCTVDYFVTVAKNLAKNKQITLKTIDEKQMKKLGMGAFLSVSRASCQDGKILILEYKGASAKEPYHALIGKGLTFDSGGISLKPPAGMDEMKFDMCGAASVFGACQAILEIKAKVNAIFVIAAAENMVAGDASRPGDIVTTHEGLSVEILNTDAEGRLVLCDTISYIKKQYKPKTIVDIATLTGACVIALGHHASALYANNDELSKKLIHAAEISSDHVWPMPLWEQYQDQMESNIADLPNVGGRDAGSITAACFLSRFANGTSWAHLDIAGSGWVSGKNKMATGRPTALLTHYLLQLNK